MTTSRRKAAEIRLKSVDIYAPEDSSGIDVSVASEYLSSLLPALRIRILPPITHGLRGSRVDEFSSALAEARVKDPSRRVQSFEPMYGEVDYERRAIAGKAKIGGIVYDGRKVESVCQDILGNRESLEKCSVVLTRRLLSTFSHDDMRHHLRTVVCGFPSVISIPGIVEAPAKPREYYLMKQRLDSVGAGDLEIAKLKSSFKGRFIDYDDPSLNEVLKGLVLQAVMFHVTLQPFCNDRECRLFNAHWQEDLISSQIDSGELCSKHRSLVARLQKEPKLIW